MSNEELLEKLENYQATRTINHIFNEAADEIRRLTVQNERLCAKFEQLRAQLNELGYRHPPLIFDEAAIAEMKAHEAHYQQQWADRMKEVSNVYHNAGL